VVRLRVETAGEKRRDIAVEDGDSAVARDSIATRLRALRQPDRCWSSL